VNNLRTRTTMNSPASVAESAWWRILRGAGTGTNRGRAGRRGKKKKGRETIHLPMGRSQREVYLRYVYDLKNGGTKRREIDL